MISEVSVATGAALVVALYFAALVAATAGSDGRGGSASSTPESEPSDLPTSDGAVAGGDGVRCRHCGTENEPGYRFCSCCLGELRGGRSGESLDRPGR